MRSLFNALALCAVTLVMSGCASQVAGTCDTSCADGCGASCKLMDHSNRLGLMHGKMRGGTCQAGCGSCTTGDTTCDACNASPVTTWATPVSECGCGDTGCGGACQAAPVDGSCNSCGQKCGGRCGMKSRPMAMPTQRTAAPGMARSRIFGGNKNQCCGGTGCGGCQDCGAAPAAMSGVYTGGFQACSTCGKAGCRGCGKSRRPMMGNGSPYGMGMSADSCGCGKFGCGEGGQLCLRCRVKNGIGQRADQATGGDCGCDSGSCGNGGCGLAGLGLGGFDRPVSRNHPFVDHLRAKGCGATGCGDGGQPCASCLGGGRGMQGGCGAPGCGVGGQPCSSCLGGGGNGGMYGGCGAPGCGAGGQPCSNCLSRMYGGHLHKKAAHLLPAQHPYGGAIPHTELQPGMGGQAPTYAYPYYTTRGPRDFLQNNPPTIGY